jgi:aminoglycoside phosphotransferase (APT) family kinase protein
MPAAASGPLQARRAGPPAPWLVRLRRALVGALMSAAIAALAVVVWLDARLRPDRGFPRDPDALRRDRGWLTRALRGAGALPEGAEVLAVAVTPTKHLEAFRSQVARVDVTIGPDAEGPSAAPAATPRTLALFAKFAPAPTSWREQAVFVLQENHVKEAAVYRELAGQPGFPAPRALAVAVHPLSGALCLLLERVEGAREVPEHEGCPAELAYAAARALARLHARWWGDEGVAAAALRTTPPAVVDWLAHQLGGPDRDLFGAMLRHAWLADAQGPRTIQHGDARVGNQLFVPAPGDERWRCLLIDWQAARRGRGVFDLVYFLVLSVEPEVRRAHGHALLGCWHAALVAEGVADYPLAQAVADARTAALLVLGFVTMPLMSAEASTTAANQQGIAALGEAWVRRMVAVVEELDVGAVAVACGVPAAALALAFQRSNDDAVRRFPAAAADRAAAQAHVAVHGRGLFGAPAANAPGDDAAALTAKPAST